MTERFPQQLIGGRYRVTGLLGKGGFGSVYAAEQLGLDRPVAVKLLHERHDDAVMRARFEREARLAQRLEHPNTVRLLDFGVDVDGTPYIVFEMLRGHSLAALLRDQGAMPPARVCRIAIQVVKSLMEAHSLGIIHRDIKPANLFVADHAGEPDFCKVLDFGIAKPLDPHGKALTNTGEVVGTPAYMAPEMLSGGTLTPASDLYSFAIVMTEMLTGHRFLTGDPLQIMLTQVAEEPLTLPPEVAQGPLAQVVARAARKKPAERYSSGAEMLRELEAVAVRLALPGGSVRPTVSATQPDEPAFPVVRVIQPVQRRDEDVLGLVVAALAIVSLLAAGAWVLYRYFGVDEYLGAPSSTAQTPSAVPIPSAKRPPVRR